MIKDLMNRDVPTVSEKDTLGTVVRLMAASGVSGVPVVDEDGMLLGIITEHDIIKVVVPSYENVREDESSRLNLDFFLQTRAQQVREKAVASVMSRNVVALAEEDPAMKAASAMLAKKYKVLPVARDGRLVGMVSRIDIAHYLLVGDE